MFRTILNVIFQNTPYMIKVLSLMLVNVGMSSSTRLLQKKATTFHIQNSLVNNDENKFDLL